MGRKCDPRGVSSSALTAAPSPLPWMGSSGTRRTLSFSLRCSSVAASLTRRSRSSLFFCTHAQQWLSITIA